jgi:protein prenyltransferase alpha subunit repeat containing protein 1
MLMESEFRICERVAEIYPKNYFAWSHRQWIVQRVMAPTMAVVPCVESHLQIPSDANLQNTSSFFPELIETWGPLGIELRRLEKWANRHVSDHSGFHQRQVFLFMLSIQNMWRVYSFCSFFFRLH